MAGHSGGSTSVLWEGQRNWRSRLRLSQQSWKLEQSHTHQNRRTSGLHVWPVCGKPGRHQSGWLPWWGCIICMCAIMYVTRCITVCWSSFTLYNNTVSHCSSLWQILQWELLMQMMVQGKFTSTMDQPQDSSLKKHRYVINLWNWWGERCGKCVSSQCVLIWVMFTCKKMKFK